MKYTITSLKERPDLFEKQEEISHDAWPEFMLHDPIANKYWMDLMHTYPDHQLLLVDKDKIIAFLTTIPLHFDNDIEDLPDEGWDWGIAKGITDIAADLSPNYLMGIQIVINPLYQGQRFSKTSVEEMKRFSESRGYSGLIIPIRPSGKSRYPLLPFDDYLAWENDKGLPFDPWLRAHVRLGARIIKTCHKSMTISGTVKDWEMWTGLSFQQSASYVIPGALNPVEIDIEKNRGIYTEPNVWIIHR